MARGRSKDSAETVSESTASKYRSRINAAIGDSRTAKTTARAYHGLVMALMIRPGTNPIANISIGPNTSFSTASHPPFRLQADTPVDYPTRHPAGRRMRRRTLREGWEEVRCRRPPA